MKNSNYLFVVCVFLSLIYSHSALAQRWGYRESFHESDSGVQGPAYQEILQAHQTLAQEFPHMVTFHQYGMSVRGVPLFAIRISAPYSAETSQLVLLTGATHGDEFLGFEHKIGEHFVKNVVHLPQLQTFLKQGGSVIIVPVVNPDGYQQRKRTNARQIDLNRDFSLQTASYGALTQPESLHLANFISNEVRGTQGGRLRVVIDYHCCYGGMLYPWSFSRPRPPTIPQQDEYGFLAVGAVMNRVFGQQYVLGKTPSLLGYEALGSTKDFYYENYGSLSFTFEGVYGGRETLEQHVHFWEGIFSLVNTN